MSTEAPEFGVIATVCFDGETASPRMIEGNGLRPATVFPGHSEDSFSKDGYRALKAADVDNMVLPLDSSSMVETLVDEIGVVSTYTLHVALYALQNPTPENIRRSLYKIGTSGDCEEHIDEDSLMPLPVPEPPGWDDYVPEEN